MGKEKKKKRKAEKAEAKSILSSGARVTLDDPKVRKLHDGRENIAYHKVREYSDTGTNFKLAELQCLIWLHNLGFMPSRLGLRRMSNDLADGWIGAFQQAPGGWVAIRWLPQSSQFFVEGVLRDGPFGEPKGYINFGFIKPQISIVVDDAMRKQVFGDRLSAVDFTDAEESVNPDETPAEADEQSIPEEETETFPDDETVTETDETEADPEVEDSDPVPNVEALHKPGNV